MEDREGFNKALESDAHIIDNAKCPVVSYILYSVIIFPEMLFSSFKYDPKTFAVI